MSSSEEQAGGDMPASGGGIGIMECPVAHVSGSQVNDDGEAGTELVDQVFGNPLLMDKILDSSISDSSYLPKVRRLRRKDLCNIRLVSTSWKEAVSNFLETKKEPLYKVMMTADNSLNGTPEGNLKILDKFVQFLNARENQDSYAGFCLILRMSVFRLENYEHLLTCLGQCGKHLVELQLYVPRNGGSLPNPFSNSESFPALQKLILGVSHRELEDIREAERLPNPSANTILMIRSMLQQIRVLKHLYLDGYIPPDFQNTTLPLSLVTLRLDCQENPLLLKCLVSNRLPEIKELYLLFNDTSTFITRIPEDLLFQVFQNLSQSLQVLKIFDEEFFLDTSLRFRFPAMEKLEYLHIRSNTCELETEIPSISTVFPKLNQLCLRYQMESRLLKWTVGTPAPLVTTLNVSVEFEIRPIPRNVMEGVHLAFPNVTNLSFHHTIDSEVPFGGLQYVFQEMRQFKRLVVYGSTQDFERLPGWDAALIGAPVNFVKGLAGSPRSFWDKVKLDNEDGLSIRLLSDLTYLQLDCGNIIDDYACEEEVSLISDLTFVYALNAMPNLKHVKLIGGFSFEVSKDIVDEWEKQDR